MKKNKIILLIGREHLEKDSYLYKTILSEIKGIRLDVFSETSWPFLSKFYQNMIQIIPKFIRKKPMIQFFYTNIKERFYSAILNSSDYKLRVAFQKNPNDISLRVEKLSKRLHKIPSHTEITLIGRSAGAIVATLVSLKHPIDKIIALGYPFKHPDLDDEAYRYEHLKHVKTPMLVIQGLQDVYGGKEIETKYLFNVHTKLVFEDINHDFELTEENRIQILGTIENFICD
jgi:hypothetical protein